MRSLADCGVGLSFRAATRVATAQGERAIGSLHPADKVWAYHPRTHKMELQPILHVWINHDLVDLTLTTSTKAQHGKATTKTSETIHTNKRHPFLTTEKGFVTVSQLKVGMHVVRASGGVGVITGWKLVPGVMTMYNLEVAQDHTFTVGAGQWVVHNCEITDDAASHIFRDAPGHMIDDTPANRQILKDTASDSSNHLGIDKYGNEWYAKTLSDGRQVWVQVRNRQVRNGGINDTPKPWDPNTGLSRP